MPRLIQKDWIKNGAVVIDAGYHPAEKCGDIDLADIDSIASAHTPVPGGVGPMTINTLILNTLLAAQKSNLACLSFHSLLDTVALMQREDPFLIYLTKEFCSIA